MFRIACTHICSLWIVSQKVANLGTERNGFLCVVILNLACEAGQNVSRLGSQKAN